MPSDRLRILIVTPEVTCVPPGMGPAARMISARAGSLGDICAAHIQMLYENGADVHLAIPNFRNRFNAVTGDLSGIDFLRRHAPLPENRIHLAEDRSFYYHSSLFCSTSWENTMIALAFQREVIHRIIPEVQPNIIHCMDWMTGLIPAMARSIGLRSIFTLYRPESPSLLLSDIEDRGIDAASFWQHCFYHRMPANYDETRSTNPVDLLMTGLFAAHQVCTLSPTYLATLTGGTGDRCAPCLKAELQNKAKAGCLVSIPPTPDASFDPADDRALIRTYTPETHFAGKLFNKLQLQDLLKLPLDSAAPMCFWPTRLDVSRPGSRLMMDVLPTLLELYGDQRLQVVFVADGDLHDHLRALIGRMDAADRAAVAGFDNRLYRLAYGSAEFVLMPQNLDPCALPCMIGQRYGALPIAFDAGAIHDCVQDLDPAADSGSGFLFKYFDANGFFWALDRAMTFYRLSRESRSAQVRRVMAESRRPDDPEETSKQLINLYAGTLGRSRLGVGSTTQDQRLPGRIAA